MEILDEIQDTVILYANILAQILKIDVTIVNSGFKRIAGTGRLIKEINTDMSEEGHILKKAMESGETQIVNEPGKNEICRDCHSREHCRETFHMSTPVMIKGQAIGVICFTCFNQKQRSHALKNQEIFKQFLQQFADLISAKAQEVLENKKNLAMKELLETIVDRLDAGVIVMDRHNLVVQTNRMCCQILKMREGDLFTVPVRLAPTGNFVGELSEYRLTAGKSGYRLVGKVFELDTEDGLTFFLFNQAERTLKDSLGLAGKRESRGLERIDGNSPQIQAVKQEMLRMVSSPSPVLILGEKGTEKAKFAMAIHEEGERAGEMVCTVNCETMPQSQIGRELFGTARTSVSKGKAGKLEAASRGTLILEEVENLPYDVQLRLGEFLDSQLVVRQGALKGVRVNTRIICTSSANLGELVEQGKFLPAFYYRINILPLYIPPLRDRKGDINLLAQKYLQRYARSMNKNIQTISDGFYACIRQYGWPGNKWELRNAMEYAANMMKLDGIIDTDLLPANLRTGVIQAEDDLNLESMEKRMIEKAVSRYGTSVEAKKKIAQALGIGMATLYRKLDKYGLKM